MKTGKNNLDAQWASVKEAATCVEQGGLIAYPTEAVYGLGCDPRHEPALQRLLALKSRNSAKGFILVASSLSQLEPYIAPMSDAQTQNVNQHWPGPVTFIVQAKPNISALLTGDRKTIAVRISAHPIVRALCDALDHALVSTSANISNQAPITDRVELEKIMGSSVDLLVEGELGGEKSATAIFDLASGKQLR